MTTYASETQSNRAWIEELYKSDRDSIVYRCFLICCDQEAAKDCMQEAFLVALLAPPFQLKAHVKGFLYLVAKRQAALRMRKATTIKQHSTKIAYLATTVQDPCTGVFAYYPSSGKVRERLRTLEQHTQMAAIAYMYAIPLEKLSKVLGLGERTLRNSLTTALRQLRNTLTGKDKGHDIGARNCAANRDKGTDEIYNLRNNGWTFKDIATRFNISRDNVANRYRSRLKAMAKYPELFKDITHKTA